MENSNEIRDEGRFEPERVILRAELRQILGLRGLISGLKWLILGLTRPIKYLSGLILGLSELI